MPQIQDQRDPEMLDSEMETESPDENDLDENAETHDSASESENGKQEDAGTEADAMNGLGAETKPVVAENPFARRGQFARADEPYDWNRCTTVITLQIMPPRAEQEVAARKVFLTARTHADPPHTANVRWSDLEPRLPEEIKLLLARVQQDLPERAAIRAAAEEAERQRQQELKAQAEKRAAERKSKAQTKRTETRRVKHNKRVDLNTPPALSASQDGVEANSTAAASPIAPPIDSPSQAVQPASVDANLEATDTRAQMSLF